MKVSAQYAEEHFPTLLATAKSGDEIEIVEPDESTFRLQFVKPTPSKRKTPRILGAGVGEMLVPSWEEWKAMDVEIAREMNDASLMPSGEV